MRLNKYVALSGVGTRRQAGEWIKAGKVKVNDKIVDNPAYMVQDTDLVLYMGKRIEPQKNYQYILMNKAKGISTLLDPPKGQRNIIDGLGKKVQAPVEAVEALRDDSTGLLVLTDDADLRSKLQNTEHYVLNRWKLFLEKPLLAEQKDALEKGIMLDDIHIPCESLIAVSGSEGKEWLWDLRCSSDVQLLTACQEKNIAVEKLGRLEYGQLTKKDLKRGWFRALSEKEVVFLKFFQG